MGVGVYLGNVETQVSLMAVDFGMTSVVLSISHAYSEVH